MPTPAFRNFAATMPPRDIFGLVAEEKHCIIMDNLNDFMPFEMGKTHLMMMKLFKCSSF
jgi:hypothetical protein